MGSWYEALTFLLSLVEVEVSRDCLPRFQKKETGVEGLDEEPGTDKADIDKKTRFLALGLV